MTAKFPKYEFLNDIDSEELQKYYGKRQIGWCQVGEEKFFVSSAYVEHGESFFYSTIRPTDHWIVTYPRSGTTWMQELVWLVNNNFNYEEATKKPLTERYFFVQFDSIDRVPNEIGSANGSQLIGETFESMSSPRFIKTHLPFQMLHPELLETCKVIYVARNPKDVIVSFYHMKKSIDTTKYTGSFESFWTFFRRDLKLWCPYWSHVKKAWSLRDHPNLLIIFYEEMKMDLPSVIKKVAEFHDRSCTEDQICKLVEHLDIDCFKKNPMISARKFDGNYIVDKDVFVRRGQVGGWRELFTPELEAQCDKWIEQNLKDTDLRFPYINLS